MIKRRINKHLRQEKETPEVDELNTTQLEKDELNSDEAEKQASDPFNDIPDAKPKLNTASLKQKLLRSKSFSKQDTINKLKTRDDIVPPLELTPEAESLIDDRVKKVGKQTPMMSIVMIAAMVSLIIVMGAMNFMPMPNLVRRADFDTNLGNVAKDIATLKSQDAHLEQVDRNYATQDTKLSSDISALQQKLTAAEQTIKTLQQEINALKAK